MLESPKKAQATDEILRKTAVLTWRGMMTKILTCLYENSEGTEMNAMMVDGCLYLEDYKRPSKRHQMTSEQQRKNTYIGYVEKASGM